MSRPLGELSHLWDAWTPHEFEMRELNPEYFAYFIAWQMQEIEDEEYSLDVQSREVIDIISLCFNWLRSLGYNEIDVAELAKLRSASRYEGQTKAIIARDEERYAKWLDIKNERAQTV